MSGDMTALELHSVQQVAVRDAGGYEVAVVAGDQVVGVEDLIDVEAGRGGGFAFGVVLGPQTTLDDSAEGLDGAGGGDGLGGAADAHEHVDSRTAAAAARAEASWGHRRPWMTPPRALMAQAVMMPSGVPPMPMSMSPPVPGRQAAMAPATSPSVMSWMRAPAARISSIIC